jgi:hypothetical protein
MQKLNLLETTRSGNRNCRPKEKEKVTAFSRALKTVLPFFAVLLSISGFAQISGIKTVGVGGDYATLTAAFSAVTTQQLNGNTDLTLLPTYNASAETFPLTVPASTATLTHTLRIYPTETGIEIGTDNPAGVFNFNGSTNVVIDGRVNATGTTAGLIFFNDNTLGFAMQFTNGSTNNTVQYCTIRGAKNNSATSGLLILLLQVLLLWGITIIQLAIVLFPVQQLHLGLLFRQLVLQVLLIQVTSLTIVVLPITFRIAYQLTGFC